MASGLDHLFFADNTILLASPELLQCTLEQFAVKCEAAEMRVRTSMSEAMVPCQKMVDCSIWIGNESLPQLKKLREGKKEVDIIY